MNAVVPEGGVIGDSGNSSSSGMGEAPLSLVRGEARSLSSADAGDGLLVRKDLIEGVGMEIRGHRLVVLLSSDSCCLEVDGPYPRGNSAGSVEAVDAAEEGVVGDSGSSSFSGEGGLFLLRGLARSLSSADNGDDLFERRDLMDGVGMAMRGHRLMILRSSGKSSPGVGSFGGSAIALQNLLHRLAVRSWVGKL
jgi:hypothetical protein